MPSDTNFAKLEFTAFVDDIQHIDTIINEYNSELDWKVDDKEYTEEFPMDNLVGGKTYNIGVKGYVHTYSWGVLGHSWLILDHEADASASTEIMILWYNRAPIKPEINGPTSGLVDRSYTYTAQTTDPDEDLIYYWFDWGDGKNSGWIGPYNSGVGCEESHSWDYADTFGIKVKARDDPNGDGDFSDSYESDWSDTLYTTIKRNKGVSKGTQITMFYTGTPVTKNIEDIVVGDYILSYDPILQTITNAEVIEVCEYTEGLSEYNLIFNGNLEVTPEQTIYIDQAEGKGQGTQVKGELGDYIWMEANDSELRDYMLENIPGETSLNPIPISSKEMSTGPAVPIYDLVIRPLQGEACGYWANGILVGGYN